ncbi:MAG: accessory Sec system translocase SecA2 [Bacteroidota bacterium]
MKFLLRPDQRAYERQERTWRAEIQNIHAQRARLIPLSEHDLRSEALDLKQQAQQGVPLPELRVAAFALVLEMAYRTLGYLAYDVQLLGSLALAEGKLIEMQTGEGKTLVGIFPSFLWALKGEGVHVYTFNDYLARRDATWVGSVLEKLGLSVAYLQQDMLDAARKKAYQAEVLYLTAKEGGFDALRARLLPPGQTAAQRKVPYALIDEIDSILIDEARIPLVLAGVWPHDTRINLEKLALLAREMPLGEAVERDESGFALFLTEQGIQQAEAHLGVQNLFDQPHEVLLVRLNQALHAEHLLQAGVDYLVREGEIVLIDEFTGRVVEAQKWPHGLQAAVEAKEGLTIAPEGKVMAKTTLQQYFQKYAFLAGMTGTARDAAEEFSRTYELEVFPVPPHKANQRVDLPDRFFLNQEQKMVALLAEIEREHHQGRPLLIGTASVAESEALARQLEAKGLTVRVLNARHHAREAAIVARAGEWGAITVATNMAGRGTDIKLGGETGARREEILASGGLYVIGTQRFESQRVDRQLRGRAGRQGDPGASRFFISLEDPLLQQHHIQKGVPVRLKRLQPEADLAQKLMAREVGHIQRVMEGKASSMRDTLGRYTSFLEAQESLLGQWREQLRAGEAAPFLQLRCPDAYRQACAHWGEEETRQFEQLLSLALIDRYWTTYLEEMDSLRQSIHLVALGGRNPLMEYQQQSAVIFETLRPAIEAEIEQRFRQLEIAAGRPDLADLGLEAPGSTWTYLISDNPFGDRLEMMLLSNSMVGFAGGAVLFAWPLLLLFALMKKWRKRADKQT